MPPPNNTANWIRLGLLALPVYGLLTFWTTLDPQPDPSTDYEASVRYVSTNYYVLSHLLGSILGLVFAIFGVFALGAYLAKGRAGRLGLVAMVITVVGNALFLPLLGVSAFAAPQEGQAHLAGIEEFAQLDPGVAGAAQAATFLLVILLSFVGNVLLGVAVWRSGTLPSGREPPGSIGPAVVPAGSRDRTGNYRQHPANSAGGRVADSDKRRMDSLERDAPAFDPGRGRSPS